MNVFLSWSGNRSKAVAEFLAVWIRCVLQSTRPWVSSHDIDRGAVWFMEIGDQLKDTSIGLVCLTQENKERPWILFEAGALAKGISSTRVCTFLIDLEPKDVADPLSHFNHTVPEMDSVKSLLSTINRRLESNSLDPRTFDKVFNKYWPEFEAEFKRLVKETPVNVSAKPRSEKDVLAELLEISRRMESRVNRLESAAGTPVSPDHVDKATEKSVLPLSAGARIKAIRKQRGLSVAELAEATGISTTGILRIERSDHIPSSRTLGRIAIALDVPVKMISGG